MSHRPEIIKSSGLTSVVPLAGVEPAISSRGIKIGPYRFLPIGSYCLFNFLAAAVAFAASERVHLATEIRSDSFFRLLSLQNFS